ncbi:Prefoldin subunit [Nakaseomyces glabratus]|nr:Prefoldin subunit [Nakaseomyces glabratus]KAH7596263.1 Prefoldin subunit [Nakaseomyces glabratus]KAH7611830.1 Prefoldin subunit [Nakaseomyces glabratus]
MESLLESVQETTAGLKSKRDFLEEQREQYVNIRQHLIELPSRQTTEAEISSNKGQVTGLVLGDVIISKMTNEMEGIESYRLFVNIGCEYYVEKDKIYTTRYIEEKISLIEDAISKFNEKIQEANTTEKHLKEAIAFEKKENDQKFIHSKQETSSIGYNEDTDDIYEPMEIREELDEEGNVISGTVTPAATDKQASEIRDKLLDVGNAQNIKKLPNNRIEEISEDNSDNQTDKDSDFYNNLKGKLVHTRSLNSSKQEKVINEKSSDELPNKPHTQRISTDEIYSFADLVEQLDKDDIEEGDDSLNELDFDEKAMDSWEINGDSPENYEDDEDEGYYYDEDEEEDEEEDGDMSYSGFGVAASVLPTNARSSFMDQIMKLRGLKDDTAADTDKSSSIKKSSIQSNDDTNSNRQLSGTKHHQTAVTKSILKKGGKQKAKKNVGFSKDLQIHEVESFKMENKKQRHVFNPANLFDPESYGAETEEKLDDPSSTADFDSDLFAELIGAKEADVLHEKYEEEINENNRKQQEEKKANRVSRFKATRQSKSKTSFKTTETGDTTNVNKPTEYTKKDLLESYHAESISPSTKKHSSITASNYNKHDSSYVPKKASPDKAVIQEVEDEIVERAVEDEVVERAVEDEIFERVVEDEVVERVVEDEVVERVVEDEVVERAVEDEVFERVVEDEIVERAVEDEIVERAVEDEVVERAVEDEIVERAVDEQIVNESISLDDDNAPANSQNTKERKVPVIPKELSRYIEKGEGGDKFPKAKIDYQSLNENLDDMVMAYSMGLYDDDVDDPGVVLEHLNDFKQYNEQVKELESEIAEFRINNPMLSEDNEEDDDGPMMTDIQEKDIPESYGQDDNGDDYSLSQDQLAQSVAIEYRNMKEKLVNKMRSDVSAIDPQTEEMKQIEPIDEHGNPVKQSRFRSQRKAIDKLIR